MNVHTDTDAFLRRDGKSRASVATSIATDLDAIQSAVEQNKRKAADDEAARVDAARAQQEGIERSRRVVSDLAQDIALSLGANSGEFLFAAIALREPMSPAVAPIWDQIKTLGNAVDRPNIPAVIEARHVLAAAGLMPSKGLSKSEADQVRRLPPARPIKVARNPAPSWYESFVRSIGLAYPQPVTPEGETEHQIMMRVERDRAAMHYDPTSADNNDRLALAERELLTKARVCAMDAAEERYCAELNAQHASIVRVIDETLAKLEMGTAYWWAREVRRWVAGERPLTQHASFNPNDPPRCWQMVNAMGVRFPFTEIED